MLREGRSITDVDEPIIIDFMRNEKGRLILTSAGIEIDGENCAEEAGQEKHGIGASKVAAIQTVRDELGNPAALDFTRKSEVHTVSEGRNEYRLFSDAGSLVAGMYLHASVESRVDRFRSEAARRLRRPPETISAQEITAMILGRDMADMTRSAEPLIPHEDALYLNTDTTPDQLELAVIKKRQIMIDTGSTTMPPSKVFEVASFVISTATRA